MKAIKLQVEGLEGRQLLTGSAILNGSGQLSIVGTKFDDTVTVGKLGAQIVVAQFSSDFTKSVQRFNAGQVKAVIYNGNEGNDTFQNLTSLNALVTPRQASDKPHRCVLQDVIRPLPPFH
jgi:hypothetical protein